MSRLVYYAVTAALAGFLFGFDTVVISGAEQKIQTLWGLDDFTHGLAISMALWGTVIGAIFGGLPTDRFGRRPTLIAIGALYLISAIWSALAGEVTSFMLARLIGGIGVGVSTVAAPLYIAEIAPPRRRGLLAGMFQFNIVFGILVAFLSNAMIADVISSAGGENAWRWMLAAEAIPAAIYVAMSFGLPESPRWLITRRGDRDAAREVIRAVDPTADEHYVKSLLEQIDASAHADSASGQPDPFFTRRLRRPIALAFLVAMFNQLSGINAILYFAPRVFELSGLEEQSAMLQSIGIGVVLVVFTMLGLWLIDRVGRRTLLIVGSIGYVGSLGSCAWAFASDTYSIVPACIFAFIAAHSLGQGTVIWVLISEVFPNRHRAAGQSLGSSTHWVFAALITQLFPLVVANVSPQMIFGFFTFMMVLHLIWVLTLVPETKNVSLESMQKQLESP